VKNMAKNQAKMQMVDDDEVENVGIMSGFMDDIEELMEEIAQQETAGEGDDADMARILDRRPDSPEVLMNNLRGDYRSIDARREELADRVGYNAAQQTPDEVLAMLQPIFAQQGIAALPMGGADVGALPMDAMTGMPPAGMPPAAMPMDPAMMGAPPAGMPPMDPAMMAPEGIASLPMDQGAMPPLQMARGGIVQYFQDGSDEDGVTPFPMALSSSTRTVSQQLRDAADEELIQFAQRRPLEVPSLQAAMEGRVPMYEELLGTGNTDAMKSSMLFDIAQAALGYAANTGPQGQPLRGSAAARLAGATQALPGQLGARLTAQQQQDQAVRMLALQAAEKDLQGIREANTAQAREQRQLLGSITRSATDSETMAQASLTPAKAYAAINSLPRVILSGNATPEQIDLFATAMSMVTQTKEYTDPLTGQLVVSRTPVPAHAQDAAAFLNQGAAEDRLRVPTGVGQLAQLGQTPEPFDQNVPPSSIDGLAIANPRTENYGQPNVANFFNAAGNATGIIPVLSAGVFKVPVLNNLARDTAGQEVQAQTFVTLGTNALVEAFNSNTARFTAEERRDLQEKLNTLPRLLSTPDSYRATLFSLDDLLQTKQEAALRNYRNTSFNMDARRAFQEQAVAINDARLLLGVPLHVDGQDDPRLSDIVLRYPVGTSMLVLNDPKSPGLPVIKTVTQEAKDALGRR
jgi:hypothetical protein